MKSGFFGKLTKAAALALVVGMVGGVAFQGSSYAISKYLPKNDTEVVSEENEAVTNTTEPITATTIGTTVSSTNISEVVDEVMPSIVAITTLSEEQVRNMFGQKMTYETEGAGSGIIIKQDSEYLYIATNNHVVSGSKTVTVQFADETLSSAEIKGLDSKDDLAVITVKVADLSEETKSAIAVAKLGDSDSIKIGSAAIAIGNALGYGQSVTTGVISAVNREISSQDENTGKTVTSTVIQTDAAINPGNSGGALLNSKGEVIGINSAKMSDTSVEGVGFAIPISLAKPLLEELIDEGKVTEAPSAYLGIYGVDVSSDVSEMYNMPVGVYIAQVISGSGAEEAGVTEGMIVTKFNGEDITSMDELKSKVSKCKVGDSVTLSVSVNDSGSYVSRDIVVVLGENTSAAEEQVEEEEEDTTEETNPYYYYFGNGSGNSNGFGDNSNPFGNFFR